MIKGLCFVEVMGTPEFLANLVIVIFPASSLCQRAIALEWLSYFPARVFVLNTGFKKLPLKANSVESVDLSTTTILSRK